MIKKTFLLAENSLIQIGVSMHEILKIRRTLTYNLCPQINKKKKKFFAAVLHSNCKCKL